MIRRLLALALVLSLSSVAVSAVAQSEGDPDVVDPWRTRSWPARPEGKAKIGKEEVLPPPYEQPYREVGEPRLPIGAVLLVSGGLLVAGGASILADAGPEVFVQSQFCNGNQCFSQTDVRDDPGAESPGIGMIAGGGATALFGGALLAHSIVEGAPFPHKSSRKVGAGMLLTGYGVGTTVGASAIVMHAAIEGNDAVIVGFVMYAPAVGLMATGLPLWITGSRPHGKGRHHVDDPNEKEVFRSPTMGSIGLGMTILGLGTAGAGIGAAVEGERREDEDFGQPDEFGFISSSDRPDTIVTVLGTVTAGVTLLSLGLPLAIIGLGKAKASEAHASASDEELELPEINVGPMGSQVTWRF